MRWLGLESLLLQRFRANMTLSQLVAERLADHLTTAADHLLYHHSLAGNRAQGITAVRYLFWFHCVVVLSLSSNENTIFLSLVTLSMSISKVKFLRYQQS